MIKSKFLILKVFVFLWALSPVAFAAVEDTTYTLKVDSNCLGNINYITPEAKPNEDGEVSVQPPEGFLHGVWSIDSGYGSIISRDSVRTKVTLRSDVLLTCNQARFIDTLIDTIPKTFSLRDGAFIVRFVAPEDGKYSLIFNKDEMDEDSIPIFRHLGIEEKYTSSYSKGDDRGYNYFKEINKGEEYSYWIEPKGGEEIELSVVKVFHVTVDYKGAGSFRSDYPFLRYGESTSIEAIDGDSWVHTHWSVDSGSTIIENVNSRETMLTAYGPIHVSMYHEWIDTYVIDTTYKTFEIKDDDFVCFVDFKPYTKGDHYIIFDDDFTPYALFNYGIGSNIFSQAVELEGMQNWREPAYFKLNVTDTSNYHYFYFYYCNMEDESYTVKFSPIMEIKYTHKAGLENRALSNILYGEEKSLYAQERIGFQFREWVIDSGSIEILEREGNRVRFKSKTSGTLMALYDTTAYHEIDKNPSSWEFVQDTILGNYYDGVFFQFTSPKAGGYGIELMASDSVNKELSYLGSNKEAFEVFKESGDSSIIVNFISDSIGQKHYFRVRPTINEGDTSTFDIRIIDAYTIDVFNSGNAVSYVDSVDRSSNARDTVQLHFEPDLGYELDYWEVTKGTATLENPNKKEPYLVLADDDVEVLAHVKKRDNHSISFKPIILNTTYDAIDSITEKGLWLKFENQLPGEYTLHVEDLFGLVEKRIDVHPDLGIQDPYSETYRGHYSYEFEILDSIGSMYFHVTGVGDLDIEKDLYIYVVPRNSSFRLISQTSFEASDTSSVFGQSSSNGEWQQGSLSPYYGPSEPNDGATVWGVNLNSNYSAGTFSQLTFSDIQIPDIPFAQISFSQWMKGESQKDYASVYAQDSTNEKFLIYSNSEKVLNWAEVTLNISQFMGQSIDLIFEFQSDSSHVADGWYIDDLKLLGVEP